MKTVLKHCLAGGTAGMLLLAGCTMAPALGRPVDPGKLSDGVYTGSYAAGPNKASVSVSVENGAIRDIRVLQHLAWRGKGVESTIVDRIIERQSTDVDAVSGATNSSRVIMNAVQAAVEKAQPQ